MQAAKKFKSTLSLFLLTVLFPCHLTERGAISIFGSLATIEVFVADPYGIALSKLDRGFDTDIEDIVFLIQSQRINIGKLEHVVQEALPQADNYDLNPDILEHLQELRNRLV